MTAEIDLVQAVTSANPGLAYRAALVGTSVGAVFSRLARMNDGEPHAAIRRAVERALATIDGATVAEASRHQALALAARADLDRFVTALPASSIASLLGVADVEVSRVADFTASVARAIALGASDEDVRAGCEAVDALRGHFADVLEGDGAPPVVEALSRGLAEDGQCDPEVALANLIGFLIQSHDATAGLIGNTLVHLARHPDLPRTLDAISRLVVEVARHHPSVHNTRRYATEPMTVGGASIRAGDTILVGLAAANLADDQRAWSFGEGRHACPGRDIAMTVAVEGVLVACETGLAPESVPEDLEYRPLGNARIPRFASSRQGKDAE